MALNAKKAAGGNGGSGPKQKAIEPGTYPARLVQIIDLGVQDMSSAKFGDKPPRQNIQLTWELVDEFMLDEDGNEQEDKPRWISEQMPLYNLKADKAKSTQRYYALDPKEDHDGDFSELLGMPANILVTTYKVKSGPNEGQERNKVDSVAAMRPRDAKSCPPLVNEPKLFVLDDPDLDIFLSLPDFLQEKIKGNLEFRGSPLEALLGGSKATPQGSDEEEPEEAPEPKKKARKTKPEPEFTPDDEDDDDLPWDE